jgi:DNA helicase-2/ATP-dependent DNA helicase PcrA
MELNKQQKIAAEYNQGHVLVLAGAGTGKTRTIIARAAHLIQTDVLPGRILLLTFTRRAAREMMDRLDEMVGPESKMIMAGTFHHFCLYTMRRMSKQFGIENATVIDRDDQIQLMKLIRTGYKEKGRDFPRASELLSLCSYARNTNQPMKDYLEAHTDYNAETTEKICKIAKEFHNRKKRSAYLDYDDILFVFAKKLNEDPMIQERIKGRYDHILVDEMQDTNPLQWMILDGLRDPAKLFCVGDDAQSIYAFRGADFRNVHSFIERVPDSRVLRLEENYRSTQGILDLSNWLLKESPMDYSKNLTAYRKTKSTPRLISFASDLGEAGWIAKDLLRRHHDQSSPWKDHMIITRTGYGARAVESQLVEGNIPYRFIGGISLLQMAHVKDILCLIRASSNHQDELAWARYLKMWPKIGDVTAARHVKNMKQCGSMGEAMGYLGKTFKNRSEILQGPGMIFENIDNPSMAVSKAAHFLIPLMEKQYDNWKKRVKDFELLERLAEKHKSITAFIETYTLDPISTTSVERLEDDDVVTLTTVHSAKGAEAPMCYLIRVEPGMYPHTRSLGSVDEMEEERRILYVAMTRAQDELILTRTFYEIGHQRMSSGYHSHGSDYFFEYLDEGLVETDSIGHDESHFSNDGVIKPWSRRWGS